MRRLVAACLAVAMASPALATPAMTTAPTDMRDAPRSRAQVVQSIPANAQIDVGGCGKTWCSASWRDISGFVLARSISTANSGPLYPAAPVVDAPPPVVVAPFGFGWGWGYGYGWRRYYY